jgi:hypothetical protein
MVIEQTGLSGSTRIAPLAGKYGRPHQFGVWIALAPSMAIDTVLGSASVDVSPMASLLKSPAATFLRMRRMIFPERLLGIHLFGRTVGVDFAESLMNPSVGVARRSRRRKLSWTKGVV